MPSLQFRGLPEYALLGTVVQGTLLVDSNKPVSAAQLSLKFRGCEISQIRVHQQRQNRQETRTFEQTVPFLEQELPFDPAAFETPNEIRRVPFSVMVPANGPPSLQTAAMPATRGRLTPRPEGLFVEYTLEARLDVPWWVDPVVIQAIPVFPAQRVLGTTPALRTPRDPSHPSVQLDVDAPQLVPGTIVAGSFQVANPTGKHLRSIAVRLDRRIEYAAQGVRRTVDGPRYESVVPLDTTETVCAGRFAIDLPNAPEATAPQQGSLYRSYWMLGAHVDVGFGFDVDVGEVVEPLSVPPPAPDPFAPSPDGP